MSQISLAQLKRGQDNLDRMKKEIELGARLLLEFVRYRREIKWDETVDVRRNLSFRSAKCRWTIVWFCGQPDEFILSCVVFLEGGGGSEEFRFATSMQSNDFVIRHAVVECVKTVYDGFNEFLEFLIEQYPELKKELNPYLAQDFKVSAEG